MPFWNRTKKSSALEAEASSAEPNKEDPADFYFLNREVSLRLWDSNTDEYVEHIGVYRGVGNLGTTEVIIIDQVDDSDPTLLRRRGFNIEQLYEISIRYKED